MINGNLPFDLPARTPEQIASRTIVVAMGGQVRNLPVLAIRPSRDWEARFTRAVELTLADLGPVDSLDDLSALASVGTDRMIELLVAYDTSGTLGGKDWIEENATRGEVYDALKQVAAAVFPFGADLAKFAPQLKPILLQAMVRLSQTSTSPSLRPTAGRRKRSKSS